VKKSEERSGVYPASETIRRHTAALRGEPLFEKRRRLCAFDSVPHRIQHAAAHRSGAAVKAQP